MTQPSRSQERFVENIRPIGSCQHHNALCGRKPIHLHKQLVQCIFALIIATGKSAPPSRAPDCINLICTRTIVL
jgi:hypothetical protein